MNYQDEYRRRVIARAEHLVDEPKDYSGADDGWHRAGQLEETCQRLLELLAEKEEDKP